MPVQSISGFSSYNGTCAYASVPMQQYNKHSCKSVAFLGSTSAGNPFKRLRNVPDAFFGGITINGAELEKIKRNLGKCTTIKKAVQYLKKYQPNMLKIERQMYERFEEVAPQSPRKTFPVLLQAWYKDALIQLKLEELDVINEIDRISLQMSPETALAVQKETTSCRKIIIDDDPQRRFKRKTVLEALGKITPKRGEEDVMKTLMETAIYLPTSSTSANAFIVKYASRSHNEICQRLVTPSLLSIDHILAASKGGPNDISNFAVTSAGANSLKQDMWFKKFVRRFPEVIVNCQKYIEYFIDIINNGGFRGNQAYPYKIRKRMIQESDGKVKLDLSLLKYTEKRRKGLKKKQENIM